jgi:mannonate dehydratase
MSHSIKVGKGLGDISEGTLQFFRQVGVEAVSIPTRYNEKKDGVLTTRPLVPPTQRGPAGPMGKPWDEAEVQRVIERVSNYGFSIEGARLGLSGNIVMGRDGREADAEISRHNIELAGKLGLGVLNYNFTALRASEGYGALPGEGRGGATLRDFDYDRIKDLPPLESVGTHSMEAMWERYHWFLEQVLPTAEASGVKLAAHPNDPPVPVYRGVAQPLGDYEGYAKLIDLVDSPSNCVFFDTGVTTEMGVDPVDAIRLFGSRGRIGTVHFRNVRVIEERFKYVEVFHDEGDADLAECMRAFHEVGYEGLIDPDHTPYLAGDNEGTQIGWAYAIGQIVGLRNAVWGERRMSD